MISLLSLPDCCRAQDMTWRHDGNWWPQLSNVQSMRAVWLLTRSSHLTPHTLTTIYPLTIHRTSPGGWSIPTNHPQSLILSADIVPRWNPNYWFQLPPLTPELSVLSGVVREDWEPRAYPVTGDRAGQEDFPETLIGFVFTGELRSRAERQTEWE